MFLMIKFYLFPSLKDVSETKAELSSLTKKLNKKFTTDNTENIRNETDIRSHKQ
jgi:hypothetical protein